MAANQKHISEAKKFSEEEVPVEPKDLSNTELGNDVDALLDEIDGVLEENAEEFIQGYVQQGGE